MCWIRSPNSRPISWSLRTALYALLIVTVGCSDGGSSDSAAGPTPPPPTSPATQIAVVGCSQTSNAWRGWLENGDTRVWGLLAGYGGGAVTDWAGGIPDGLYWGRLETNTAGNLAPDALWWQLCDRNNSPATVEQAEAVLNEIHRRMPAVMIYASPLADFEKPETCTKQNIANSNALVDHVIGTGLAQRGPDLPMVLDDWIQPPEGDGGCHVGPTGAAEFGSGLAAFDWRG